MRLYEFAPTRSIRARWTLQELGVPFEAVSVNLVTGEHRQSPFLALNPAGKVPVLEDGDMVLTESVAIVLYLAEKYPEKLCPGGASCPRRTCPLAAVYRDRAGAAAMADQPPQRDLPRGQAVARRDRAGARGFPGHGKGARSAYG
jgi:glutathione S-transferase